MEVVLYLFNVYFIQISAQEAKGTLVEGYLLNNFSQISLHSSKTEK